MNDDICALCQRKLVLRWVGIEDTETGDAFSIWRCISCGLGVTRPFPDSLDRYYPAAYHGGRHGITTLICDRRRLRILAASKSHPGQCHVLDVGCGDGSFLRAAQKAGWRVAGVERYPDRTRASGFSVFSSPQAAASEGGFDFVTLWHVLEHWSSPHDAIEAIGTLLNPDGVILIAVPDSASWQARWFGRYWLHLDVPRHLYHFTAKSLLLLLRQHGFSGVQLSASEFEYDVMGWAQSSLNRVSSRKNVFFRTLTGRRSGVGKLHTVVHTLVGAALIGFAAFPVFLSGRLGLGGTLLFVARKTDDGRKDPMHVS